ncbi:cupin domain-containing protein [Bremerella alba]|uniref:Cupin type-2 domain-containing protein n=1 Tax=Bremerella alba TaxID=980252 RepID=A0A7V9A699_9BACT|nr:cupin domain-containing protein [Bremerella alba]MBA2114170.1 hypothetical protein [Bremerella alba]
MEPASTQTTMIRSLKEDFGPVRSTVLFLSDRMKVVRLSLQAEEALKEHRAPGPLVVQCLEGKVDFSVEGHPRQLQPGDLLHLASRETHAVHALEDSVLLLTIAPDK